MYKFAISPIPANFQKVENPIQQIEELERLFNLSTSDDQRRKYLEIIGMQALRDKSVDGSQFFHVHRWTNAKRFKKLQNDSCLIILRCRRCEQMKSVEIYIEYDRSGRAVVKRLDSMIDPLATESMSLSDSKESDTLK